MRSGWVVVLFAAVAVVVEAAITGTLWFFEALPRAPYVLGDPHLAITSSTHLVSALVATAVAWKLGAPPMHEKPLRFFWGAALGAVLITLAVAPGVIGFSACDTRLNAALIQLVTLAPTALAEELWLRGSALTALARGVNAPFAVVGTGIVFGLLHLANPHASAIAALNVALVGIWFGSLTWRAQSIWPAFGAHLAWNWFEGFFWGQHVSGIRSSCSLFAATPRSAFFNGGDFGPEAAGVTSLLLVLACLATAFWPRGRRWRTDPPPAERK